MENRMRGTLGLWVLSLVVVFSLNGCKTNGEGSSSTTLGGMEPTTVGERLPEFDQEWLFEPATGLKPIYFDFDSYDLRADALATLRENAQKVRKVPGVIIQIEGHCDERGTQEYNLNLGEKRALATRAHLIQLGVSGDRIITISYGEEVPKDSGHNEGAWSKNRRCEFNRAI